ncbi:SCP2 sterol-binding domain-containing protein [Salinibacterium sp. ZJ454]|uniref:SCP2 sterol-binding domain-containing protein n=1 Tax=Salinibacterium sp. ZJ454 TaxID=2708339 RepID=UPI0014202481|nr:SCP2 sterol-binding domain-containing protein [Salinibacterium sp. ZJ454]
MTDPQQSQTAHPVADFFDELGRRGDEPLLRKISGRIRFDVIDDPPADGTAPHADSWTVETRQGQLTVTRDAALAGAQADCTIRGRRSVFENLVSGRANANAAVIRGALEANGDLQLMVAIQRIFPAPPPGYDPTAATRSH